MINVNTFFVDIRQAIAVELKFVFDEKENFKQHIFNSLDIINESTDELGDDYHTIH